jgi:hypothetical protein
MLSPKTAATCKSARAEKAKNKAAADGAAKRVNFIRALCASGALSHNYFANGRQFATQTAKAITGQILARIKKATQERRRQPPVYFLLR